MKKTKHAAPSPHKKKAHHHQQPAHQEDLSDMVAVHEKSDELARALDPKKKFVSDDQRLEFIALNS